MNVDARWYAQAAKDMRLELPPWLGAGEYESAATVIAMVAKEADQYLAERLWYYLLTTHLSYEQMLSLGGKMIADGTHIASCNLANAVTDGTISDALRPYRWAISRLDIASQQLGLWIADDDKAYSDYYTVYDEIQLQTVQGIFFLPWRQSRDGSDTWFLLLSACQFLGEIGVGPVGLGNTFAVKVEHADGGSSKLNLEFVARSEKIGLLGNKKDPATTIWASAEGMEKTRISMGIGQLTSIYHHLNLSPDMSRNGIEEELRRSLTFTVQEP